MDFKNLDEIIDFAIEKEKEAVEFYQSISKEEKFSGKRQMLEEFAEQERKHQRLLEDFKAGKAENKLADYKFKWITDIKRSDFSDDIVYRPGMPYNEILMLAAKREEKALKLYNELLAKAESEEARKVFKVLCQEEAKHKLALESLYDDFMAEMGD